MAKYTIGVMMSQLEGGYQGSLWPGFAEAAEKYGVNLLLLTGKVPGQFDENYYQHEIIYHFAKNQLIDGLIVLSATLSSSLAEEFEDFISQFSHLPMVCIGKPVKGATLLDVDHQAGIYKAVRHLYEVHSRTKIAFMKGMVGHPDSESRYEAYLDTLSELNLDFDPDRVVEGGFTQEGGVKAMETLLARNIEFDAIVCANDEMAIGASARLKDTRFFVPDDISIVGFDNIFDCQLVNPAIATVEQPIYEMGVRCIEVMIEKLDGELVEELETIDTKFLPRASCGCLTTITSDILNNYRASDADDFSDREKFKTKVYEILASSNFTPESKDSFIKCALDIADAPEDRQRYSEFMGCLYAVLDDLEVRLNDIEKTHLMITQLRNLVSLEHSELSDDKIEKYFNYLRASVSEVNSTKNSIITHHFIVNLYRLRSLTADLLSVVDYNDLVKVLTQRYSKELSDEYYVVLYDGEMIHRAGQAWKFPKQSRLLFGFDHGAILNAEKTPVFNTSELLPEEIKNRTRFSYVVMPLFYGNHHFGYVCQSVRTYENDSLYESLRELISGVLWSALLHEKLNKSQDALKSSNARLKRLSITDELTGLKNRRGLLTTAEHHAKICIRRKDQYAVAFIDLDGLKTINDTHGHEQGDNAIKGTARVLKSTFRESDVISRQGGDEFVVLLTGNVTKVELNAIEQRLNNNLEQFNQAHDYPFTLSASIGFSVFDPIDNSVSLDELMKQADAKLYDQKVAKKSSKTH